MTSASLASLVRSVAWAAVLALAAGVASAADTARWADPAKTLRVMFPIAETGFDPRRRRIITRAISTA